MPGSADCLRLDDSNMEGSEIEYVNVDVCVYVCVLFHLYVPTIYMHREKNNRVYSNFNFLNQNYEEETKQENWIWLQEDYMTMGHRILHK